MDPILQPATSATPSGEAAGLRPQPVGGRPLSRLEPGASLFRHKWLALSLFLLNSFAGLTISYIQGSPAYRARAVVSVSPLLIQNPQGDAEVQLQPNSRCREYVQQNVRALNRIDIVQQTLSRLGGNGRRWWYRSGESDRRAAERLAAKLRITPSPDSCQVTVELAGDKPQGLAELVNTLLGVYLEARKSEQFGGGDSRLQALRQELDGIAKEQAEYETQKTQLVRQLGVRTFPENYVNPFAQPLASAKLALARARRETTAQAEPLGLAGPSPSARNAGLPPSEQTLKELEAEVALQESQVSWFAAKYQSAISLSRRIEEARQRQAAAEARGRSLDLESQSPGVVRIFAAAQPTSLPSQGGWPKLQLLFVLLGVVAAILVPTAVDLADPRLLVPPDVARALGAEPLGWVPEREECGEEFTWELILRLANRIDQQRQTQGGRIWMFTAVKSGCGTTTLVNSLARALTMCGVPALAVEANAYRADGRFAHNATGLGLSVLLHGHSTLNESIETADAEMPDHIPIGELDGSGHLPDIHRLKEILTEALESYALVLVDIPPVFTSVDSEYLARRADCVVLVAEARQVAMPELKRAAKLLERVQTRAVACVLNRVHAADGRGFAEAARREFEAGAAKTTPGWH